MGAAGLTAVAVVGLGAMGSRIVRRLLDRGHDVVVWNRDPAKAAPLLGAGAVAAASPADAARRADAVFVVVADPAALIAVTEGDDGVAAGAAGTAVVQMSTVSPDAITRLAAALPADAELLDAPVLGSIGEAEAGTLTVFAGGAGPVVERWTPLLSELGSVRHVGGLGAGTAAKLVANAALVASLAALGETLALARGVGLPHDVTFDVLSLTPLAAQAERRRTPFERSDYPPRFTLALARKDADLIAAAADEHGVDLRLLEVARSWLADAEAAGLGAADYSALLETIAR